MGKNYFKQILTPLKMSKLEKLGIDISDASAYLSNRKKLQWKTGYQKLEPGSSFIYTIWDIVEKLPKKISLGGHDFSLVIHPGENIMYFDEVYGSTLVEFNKLSWQSDIDMFFDCFKWCILNKHI